MPSTSLQNEIVSRMERQTKDGRTLSYRMEVVQQPERARACGAGAKSSADRRPVDPPPIVDLRIFDITAEEHKDITSAHDANFFLYTTLEHVRPINQGRVPVSTATLPVLTGTPVAGMAYLDRPKQAGYFIFPDLAVRHEGVYRLSFNLYEELKNPEKDADLGTDTDAKTGDTGRAPKNFAHFRLEVKSNPFNVFSAKKFPGLAESTELSRCVNEQGCRVRIRRDVRMRRRDKGGDGYKDIGDDIAPPPAERYPVQQQAPERPRSTSNASEVASHYSTERRQSYHDINYYQASAYQQAHPHPHAPQPQQQPQSAASYASHLSFGGPNTPHYQTPAMITHQQPPMNHYQQPATSYQYTQQNHSRPYSGHQNYAYAGQPSPQVAYSPSGYIDDRPYTDSRRSSGGYQIGRSQAATDPYDHGRSSYQVPRSLTPINTSSLTQGPPSLPPIKALPLEPLSSEPQSANSIVPHGPHNPYSTSSYSSGGYHTYNSTPQQAAKTISTTQPKRQYGEVFDATRMDQPLHQGMRPSTAIQSQDIPHIETADGEYTDMYAGEDDLTMPLIYKRADGSRRAKKCPSPRDSHRPYQSAKQRTH